MTVAEAKRRKRARRASRQQQQKRAEQILRVHCISLELSADAVAQAQAELIGYVAARRFLDARKTTS